MKFMYVTLKKYFKLSKSKHDTYDVLDKTWNTNNDE